MSKGSSHNMPGHLHVDMFHDNKIRLGQEIKHHPELCKLLDQYSMDELGPKLAEIAAYVDIALDGDYYPEDIDELCGILAKRLYEKRLPIILN